jgi:hypothetical protein
MHDTFHKPYFSTRQYAKPRCVFVPTFLQGVGVEAVPVWAKAAVSVLAGLYGQCHAYALVDAGDICYRSYNASDEKDIKQGNISQEGGIPCPAAL